MIASVLLAAGESGALVPPLLWSWPFVVLLLVIALFPLLKPTHHWWEENRNKLIVSLLLALITLAYYFLRSYGVASHEPAAESHAPPGAAQLESAPAPETAIEQQGVHRTAPGLPTVAAVLRHAVLDEYVPFLVLLFSLYTISGGIVVRGDLRPTPLVNTAFLALGGALASFIGTTGASMILIRPLLRMNQSRRRVVHTVVFFIFIVSNVGGLLLPIGDPPLFLGYLKGVPFFWTLQLWREWAFMLAMLLFIYLMWDRYAYAREDLTVVAPVEAGPRQPLRVAGWHNALWLLLVVTAVATLDPSKPFPGTNWHAPVFLRELVQLALAGAALLTTSSALRRENQFNFVAIGEVACLFIGIFITMQVPLEILHARGPELGLVHMWQFFWSSGILSSFLDNAPTYVVFFEVARTLPPQGPYITLVDGGIVQTNLLIAVSIGSVFMGANTYIGNGPNFMVKTIAEQSGVNMPSFFGYMIYSGLVLVPLYFVLMALYMFVQ